MTRPAAPKPTMPLCPLCGSSVERVHRRFLDRLLSLVRPIRRYRCKGFHCNWEGNLRRPDR